MAGFEDIEDPVNITGLPSLLNKEHTDHKLDLEAVAKSIMGSGHKLRPIPEKDPSREFNETLRELSRETGIDFGAGDSQDAAEEASSVPRGEYGAPQAEELQYEDAGGEDITYGEAEEAPDETADFGGGNEDFYNDINAIPTEQPKDDTRDFHQDYDTYFGAARTANKQAVRVPTRPVPGALPILSARQPVPGANAYRSAPPRGAAPPNDIDSALRAYNGNMPQMDEKRENEEDVKLDLLEAIDELRGELESEGVDLKTIPLVNDASPYEMVEKAHYLLNRKYNRRRGGTFGRESILAAAKVLGYAFDGKRRIGPFAPNLSGWDNTIRPKLRRMKYETSQVVADTMDYMNMGPLSRILFELVPSAFLYSSSQKEQHGKKNYTPDQMSEAFDDLQQFDT